VEPALPVVPGLRLAPAGRRTGADCPIGTGVPSAMSSFQAFASTVNASGFPSLSTFVTPSRAASSERSESGARSDANVTVAVPEISSFAMSNRSSATYFSM
jgi:hypothetical protein